MKISYNASAVLANNSLTLADNKLSSSLQKLSSGLKINDAKDNPSGLAMSKRMNAQIEGISVATQNASDGISVIEIADGAMSEIQDMLQRINELCVKASTGSLSDNDRELINQEVQELKEEITRISDETEFNGQKILDGSFDLKGYTSEQDVKISYYGDDVKAGKYEITDLKVKYDADGNIELTSGETKATYGAGFPADAEITSADGNVLTITGSPDFELKLEIRGGTAGGTQTVADSTATPAQSLTMDLTGIGAMDMQIGANEGQELAIRIPKLSLQNMEISNLDLSTKEGALEGLSKIGDAIKYVSSTRSRLGAYQNRLEHTINSLDVTSENMTSAYSRIMDVDMAEEMTNYTTLQVISQASTSMLAQANERPSQVLQLLQ